MKTTKCNNTTSYRITNLDTDLHMMPMADIIEHKDDVNCECIPYLDMKNERDKKNGLASKSVWVHRYLKNIENTH